MWVTTLTGQVLYHRRGTPEGMVSFTTPRAPGPSDMDDDIGVGEGAGPPQKDTYRVCVEHQLRASDAVTQGARRLVSYRLNDARIPRLPGSGPRATSKHAGVLVNRLQEMHESLTGMVGDLDELERREFRLLERNYRMSTRLAILAAVSLIALVATSVIQCNYYRVYFKAKKIC